MFFPWVGWVTIVVWKPQINHRSLLYWQMVPGTSTANLVECYRAVGSHREVEEWGCAPRCSSYGDPLCCPTALPQVLPAHPSSCTSYLQALPCKQHGILFIQLGEIKAGAELEGLRLILLGCSLCYVGNAGPLLSAFPPLGVELLCVFRLDHFVIPPQTVSF